MLAADKSIAEIARDLGIGESTLGNWVGKAKENGVVQDRALDNSERAELKRLREENRVVKMERDFLSQAAAFIASQHR